MVAKMIVKSYHQSAKCDTFTSKPRCDVTMGLEAATLPMQMSFTVTPNS